MTLWHDVFDVAEPSATKVRTALNDLLVESDFVSLHTNLDESSYHMISDDELQIMKPTAYLVNTARGALIDQLALTRALQSNQLPHWIFLRLNHLLKMIPLLGCQMLFVFHILVLQPMKLALQCEKLAVENLISVIAGKTPPAPVNPDVLLQ